MSKCQLRYCFWPPFMSNFESCVFSATDFQTFARSIRIFWIYCLIRGNIFKIINSHMISDKSWITGEINSRHCVWWWLWNIGERHVQGLSHDDVIKWKHFPRNWPFVREIHRPPVNFPHKGQWRRALMFFFIYASINDWVNNHEAGDCKTPAWSLWRHRNASLNSLWSSDVIWCYGHVHNVSGNVLMPFNVGLFIHWTLSFKRFPSRKRIWKWIMKNTCFQNRSHRNIHVYVFVPSIILENCVQHINLRAARRFTCCP